MNEKYWGDSIYLLAKKHVRQATHLKLPGKLLCLNVRPHDECQATERMVLFKAKEKQKEITGFERKMMSLVLEMYRGASKISRGKL